MNLFDFLIFATYFLGGFLLGNYLIRFGAIYGILGFFVGLFGTMLLFRCLGWMLRRRK